MAQYDALVVLGGGRNGDGELTELSRQRLDKAISLYKEGAAPTLFALGGNKSTYRPGAIHFDKTGAQLRKEYFVEAGIPADAIVTVENGRDTLGEAFATRSTVSSLGLQAIGLVTSEVHMPRSEWLFSRIYGEGVMISPIPVDSGDLLIPDEEAEYMRTIQNYFQKFPTYIPDPNLETWFDDHAALYRQYLEIHDRYHPAGKESQAYAGVRKETK